ncbi:MAG: tRNA preQ1(34) S-adenosylmethionine ribosyltransferase-isomerase QueA [Phycisphaerales bacterium]
MLTTDLDYELPERLIATHPVEPRDSCRLMVVSRSDPRVLEHRVFRDLPEHLRPGDAMVFNTSGVLPAKIQGRRAGTGAAVEGLFIKSLSPGRWELMLKTGTRLTPGVEVELHDAHANPTDVRLRLIERADDRWLAAVVDAAGTTIEKPEGEVLGRVGATPLPPYIRKARKDRGDATDDDLDRRWYQCVYAEGAASTGSRRETGGSVAAPTAGLHFTPGLLDTLAHRGVHRADVRLHVGIGTFKPVAAERIEDHPIHSEWIDVPAPAIRTVERAHASGDRVFAVGTTAVRTLESLPDPLTDAYRAGGYQADTTLYVMPGFRFRHVDALITNFHLPRSTLLAMVGALFEPGPDAGPAGVPRLLELYREAVREGYRFYSYGDAMLILP